MASPWILSQTKDHSSFPGSGGISILFLAQRLILLLVFTPKQMVRWNKPIGSWKLPCAVISSNQTTWSTVLAWIEYAHNFMTSSTTGFSLFESFLGYQPPLFPSTVSERSVPSVLHHICRCQRLWRLFRSACCLYCSFILNRAVWVSVPTSTYTPGQMA